MTSTGAAGAHPRHRLDDTIHAPVRLSVVSALSGVERAEFGEVRDAVEVSDSVLSKQVAVLEAAGYVEVTKGRVGRRPRTWLALTREGREALQSHLAALRALLGAELVEPGRQHHG
ncbi:winged helix-turn-helix domain-containing protein [Quadrisphaera sp. KR29]|uniref:winged helix-turn-helix domain-containing protein n=1 Tax=Quadrisphaera sp. KR29 TaxID=3461391 RepID=UPI004044FDA8